MQPTQLPNQTSSTKEDPGKENTLRNVRLRRKGKRKEPRIRPEKVRAPPPPP